MTMLNLFARGFFYGFTALALLAIPKAAQTANDDFQRLTQAWKVPQLLAYNDDALTARLQLLDAAPAQSVVRILTFTFEHGESTRKLAAHVCKAAARGVRVEFITDSKYGSLPGRPNLFDNEHNEELYQHMVNCGYQANSRLPRVEHRIHNHFPEGEAFRMIGEKAVPTAAYLRVRNSHSPLNRLNHRKLFSVRTPDGRFCFILGGRNLGDHYLAWKSDSFIDGDILLCHNTAAPGTDPAALMAASDASFTELWNDRDPGGAGIPTTVYSISPNPQFQFSKETALPQPENTLAQPPVRGHALVRAYGWEFLSTGWARDQRNGARDFVREKLYDLIDREQAEIFIESAYMEYDEIMQQKLEAALARGVKVIVISNSFFVSDGPSKLISIVRQPWTAQMLRNYGGQNPPSEIEELLSPNVRPVGGHGNWIRDQQGRFSFFVTTVMSGHMIHFKGAGFKCQRSDSGYHKAFLLGSHNFHERSGIADKEHALTWKEPIDLACAEKLNLPNQAEILRDLYVEISGRPGYFALKPEFYDLTEARLAGFYLANNFSGRFASSGSGLGAFTGASADELGIRSERQLFTEGNRPMLFAYRNLAAEMSAMDAARVSRNESDAFCGDSLAEANLTDSQRTRLEQLCRDIGATAGARRGFSIDANRAGSELLRRLAARYVYEPGTNFEDIPEYRNGAARVIQWMQQSNASRWLEEIL